MGQKKSKPQNLAVNLEPGIHNESYTCNIGAPPPYEERGSLICQPSAPLWDETMIISEKKSTTTVARCDTLPVYKQNLFDNVAANVSNSTVVQRQNPSQNYKHDIFNHSLKMNTSEKNTSNSLYPMLNCPSGHYDPQYFSKERTTSGKQSVNTTSTTITPTDTLLNACQPLKTNSNNQRKLTSPSSTTNDEFYKLPITTTIADTVQVQVQPSSFVSKSTANIMKSSDYQQFKDCIKRQNQEKDYHAIIATTSCAINEDCKYKDSHRNRKKNQRKRNESSSHSRDHSVESQSKVKPLLGYIFLEELSKQNSNLVIIKLMKKKSEFQEILKTKLRPDLLVLLVKVLSKVSNAQFHENQQELLECACCSEFLDQLGYHMSKPSEQRKERFSSFLDDLVLILEGMQDLLLHVNKNSLLELWKKFRHATKFYESVLYNEAILHKIEKILSSTNKPSNNFRNLSLFPTLSDILSDDVEFLQPNLTMGQYEDVEHYLEVQFHLLREDFMAPLRKGISEYLSGTGRKVDSVRLYKRVKFVRPHVISDRIGLLLNFDPEGLMMKKTWETSKTLMFGSLLCFTRNNFQDMFSATIIEWNVKLLKQGLTVVQLGEECQFPHDLFSGYYVMVESEVFFEPYFQVMKVLRSLNDSTFPMKKYIVKVNRNNSAPKYMQNIPKGLSYQVQKWQVKALNAATWPDAAQLDLDEAQHLAFRTALTSELAIIQGPPGTGKTYLSLKVTEVLLQNAQLWNTPSCPILVVCCTNHALDQFLEGVLEHTKEVVRIGGQSKSKVLEEFTLKKWRNKYYIRGCQSFKMRNIQRKISSLISKVKRIQEDLKDIFKRGIVSLSNLQEVIPCEQHCISLHSNQQLLEWLQGDLHSFMSQTQSYSAFSHRTLFNCETDDELEDYNSDDEYHWRRRETVEDALDLDTSIPLSRISFAVNFEQLLGERKDLEVLLQASENNVSYRKRFQKLTAQLEYYEVLMKELEEKWHTSNGHPGQNEASTLNLWQLTPVKRRRLYCYWLTLLQNQLLLDLHDTQKDYLCNRQLFQELQTDQDAKILREAMIIGMTTTGAARFRSLLETIESKIVIVEEAAEVMETHVVASVTRHCEHLILIGDHKQLRPSVAEHSLAQDYQFDVSLFERLLNNGIPCKCLVTQHRMRPEIAQLLTPTIYPKLLNHQSVKQYPAVLGMDKSLFFLSHSNQEN